MSLEQRQLMLESLGSAVLLGMSHHLISSLISPGKLAVLTGANSQT